jgi:hypothetical protein
MKHRLLHITLISTMLLFFSCTKEVTQEELIKSAVQLKLDQWQASQIKICREEAYQKAEAYVDSLLLVTSLENKLDTIPKPEKPVKPPKPAFKAKPDSVIVDKIYKKE